LPRARAAWRALDPGAGPRRGATGQGARPGRAAGRPGHAGGAVRHRHGQRGRAHRQCQHGLHAHVPGRGRHSRERCRPSQASDERAGAISPRPCSAPIPVALLRPRWRSLSAPGTSSPAASM
jgi:hypothetical protein